MNNKIITWSILGIIIVVFASYFTLLYALFPSGSETRALFEEAIAKVELGDWESAQRSLERLKKNWSRQKYWIALNYAEEEFEHFISDFSRLHGAVRSKDKALTLILATACAEQWPHFLKIIPEP